MAWRRWWPLAAWLGLAGLGAVWFTVSVLAERGRALREVEVRAATLAEVTVENVHRLIEGADTALIAVSVMVGPNPDWGVLSRDPVLWQAMHTMGAALSAAPRLLAIDQDGVVRVHGEIFKITPGSVADRDYFISHRDDPSALPHLGVPLIGRFFHESVLPYSRRLSRADGSFGGVVLATLPPQAFMGLFASMRAEDGSFFALRRGDGTLLVRYPAMDRILGTRIDNGKAFPALVDHRPEGVALVDSPVDGVRRMVAFKRLDRYDLTMIVGLPLQEGLAPWRRQTRRMAAVVGSGLVVLTALLVLLLQRRHAEIAVQTRLKASEENLRQAQAVARLGYYVFDMVADRWESSPILDDIFGIGSAFPRSAGGWLDLVAPPQRPEMEEYLRGIIAGAHDFEREYPIIRPSDGQMRWVAGVGKVERDPDGRPLRMVGTIQDITERKRDHQALQEKAAELSRSNEELEQFAYVASHDLREPLRMVSSYVDLLGRRYGDRLDADAREFITFAKDGATRMDRLVLDLLEYSRIGRITRPMVAVPLGTVFDRVTRALRAKIDEAGARLVVPSPLPTVLGDGDELVRLFLNLIGNAVKYRGADRPPVVTVTAERHDMGWTVTVADNGIGIEPQYFERVFLIFQRLHKRGEYEGTGIGLAICKKIAEHHGGRIWLDSTPGQGSAFHVALPGVD